MNIKDVSFSSTTSVHNIFVYEYLSIDAGDGRTHIHTHMMVFVSGVRYFCTISAKTKVCTPILTELQEVQFHNNPFTDSSLFHEYRQTTAQCSAVNVSKNPSRQQNVSYKLLYSWTHCWKILLTVRDSKVAGYFRTTQATIFSTLLNA